MHARPLRHHHNQTRPGPSTGGHDRMSEQSISFGNPYLSTGSSSVTHIANVPDNDMTDITRLLELWRNKYPRNLLRSAFYDAKPTIQQPRHQHPEHRRPESRRRGRLATEKRARARRQERVRGIRDRRRGRQPRHRRDHAHERARNRHERGRHQLLQALLQLPDHRLRPGRQQRILITRARPTGPPHYGTTNADASKPR